MRPDSPECRQNAIVIPMRLGLIIICAATPGMAASEVLLTPQEFEAKVTGKTFTYSSGGTPYGAEEYLDNRRVRWSDLDGECQEGTWYVSGENICFIYDGMTEPHCWTFFNNKGKLLAKFNDDPADGEIYETSRQAEPLICLGPKVGV